MTLTDLMPSLRRTLPDPFTIDRWPEFTTVTPDDISVAGVSLTRLVDWCSTPCVHTAAAVIPGTHGRPSETELASVVVTRVTTVSASPDGIRQVELDAVISGCNATAREIRLIGRASTSHRRTASLISAAPLGRAEIVVELPADLRAGDLLAIPCAGVTCLHDVRPASVR